MSVIPDRLEEGEVLQWNGRVWVVVRKIVLAGAIVLVAQSEGGKIAITADANGTFAAEHPAIAAVDRFIDPDPGIQCLDRWSEITIATTSTATAMSSTP